MWQSCIIDFEVELWPWICFALETKVQYYDLYSL